MEFQKRDLTECELEKMLNLQDYNQLRALFKMYNTMKVISECQRNQIEERLKELEPPRPRNGRCSGVNYGYGGGAGKRSRATRRNGNLRKRRSRKGRRTSRKGKL